MSVLAGKADADVRIGGVDVSTVDRFTLRRTLGVSFHGAPLFSGSLKENVLAGAPADRLADALAAASAEDIVEGLPGGAESVLAERGRSLSGGQRQRLALARALAARHPILVLHDPTTAVDAVTEARIGAGVRAARAGLTTVVVTSSPILLAAADRVLLVTEGEVVAAGSHAELVDRPDYRDLVLR
jgi:putative ABC transport system ATP-binding protein